MGKTKDANYGKVNTSEVICELTETDHWLNNACNPL